LLKDRSQAQESGKEITETAVLERNKKKVENVFMDLASLSNRFKVLNPSMRRGEKRGRGKPADAKRERSQKKQPNQTASLRKKTKIRKESGRESVEGIWPGATKTKGGRQEV